MKRTKGNGTDKVIKFPKKGAAEWDQFIEPRILTGMIISNKILQQVHAAGDEPFKSPEVAIVAGWVLEHYERYNQAPGEAHMEDLYRAKMRDAVVPDDQGELIELMLERASEDYESGSFNEQYMLDQARDYFRYRRLEAHEQEIQQLRETGRFDEAERLNAEYEPPAMGGARDPAAHIMGIDELVATMPKRPPRLVDPWLRAGEYTLMFSWRGGGKTHLTLLLSYLLTLRKGDSEDVMVGPFYVKQPAGVLYLDGEMGPERMQELRDEFAWLGQPHPERELKLMCRTEFSAAEGQDLDLSNPAVQHSILRWLKQHPAYKVIVLDSERTLFNLESENDSGEWYRKVFPFIAALKGLGVAVILLHHAGKGGAQRGTSAREDPADNVFHLTSVVDRGQEKPHFILSADEADGGKQRGTYFAPVTLRFFQPEGRGRTEWDEREAPDNPGRDARAVRDHKIIAELVTGHRSLQEIAKDYRVSKTTVHRIKQQAIKDGYLDQDGKPSAKGREHAARYQEASPEPGTNG